MEKLSNRWMFYCGLLVGMNASVEDLKHIQDLIDAEEQGLLLKLPCKIGDDVYMIPSKANYDLNVLHRHEESNRVYRQKVDRICLDDGYWWLECDKDREYGTGRICVNTMFGETWFLSREEAEAKLRELQSEVANNE